MANLESANFNKAPIRDWSAYHNPNSIQAFLREGKISNTDAIRRFESSGTRGLYLAARLCTEQAYIAQNFDDSSAWVNRAAENYNKILIQNKDISGSKSLQLASIMGRAQLPLHGFMACFRESPPMTLLTKCYKESVGLIQDSVSEFKNGEVPTSNHSEFVGNLTETSVLLLSQRYTQREIGDNSWFALSSLYSQDHANHKKDLVSNAWDMTVFTDYGDGATGSYFVQIKSTNSVSGLRDKYFADGITPLYFFPQLFLQNEEGLPQIGIITQLQKELEGDSTVSNVLDLRTAKLLDVLG